MTYYYSSSTNGFYLSELHAEIPADAVPVADDLYTQLIAGIEAGCEIVAVVDDVPVMTVTPRPSPYHSYDKGTGNWVLTDEAAAQQTADLQAVLREQAAAEVVYAATIIAALQDEIELDEDGDTAVAEAQLADWRRYRVACLKVQRGQLTELPARPA